jgi:molybdopterin adenylyltransferase
MQTSQLSDRLLIHETLTRNESHSHRGYDVPVKETKATQIGILTVSDRASRGEYDDRGGPGITDYLNRVLTSPWTPRFCMVPDEQGLIEQAIRDLVADGCAMVLTTGGTGPASRDVTPEATEAVCDKKLPGFGEAMRAASLQVVPTAILSRQTAGIHRRALIVNLPGQPKAIAECLDAVFAAIPYCLDLIEGPFLETDPDRIVAFRPGS